MFERVNPADYPCEVASSNEDRFSDARFQFPRTCGCISTCQTKQITARAKTRGTFIFTLAGKIVSGARMLRQVDATAGPSFDSGVTCTRILFTRLQVSSPALVVAGAVAVSGFQAALRLI